MYWAHVVTDEATALGEPAVVIVGEGEEVVHEITLAVSDLDEVQRLLMESGWMPDVDQRRQVEPGYYVEPVSKA